MAGRGVCLKYPHIALAVDKSPSILPSYMIIFVGCTRLSISTCRNIGFSIYLFFPLGRNSDAAKNVKKRTTIPNTVSYVRSVDADFLHDPLLVVL